jgi:hypothetical protein
MGDDTPEPARDGPEPSKLTSSELLRDDVPNVRREHVVKA